MQCEKLTLLDFAEARLHQRHLQVVTSTRFYDIVIGGSLRGIARGLFKILVYFLRGINWTFIHNLRIKQVVFVLLSCLRLIIDFSQIRHGLLSIPFFNRRTLHYFGMFFNFFRVIRIKYFLHQAELALLFLANQGLVKVSHCIRL